MPVAEVRGADRRQDDLRAERVADAVNADAGPDQFAQQGCHAVLADRPGTVLHLPHRQPAHDLAGVEREAAGGLRFVRDRLRLEVAQVVEVGDGRVRRTDPAPGTDDVAGAGPLTLAGLRAVAVQQREEQFGELACRRVVQAVALGQLVEPLGVGGRQSEAELVHVGAVPCGLGVAQAGSVTGDLRAPALRADQALAGPEHADQQRPAGATGRRDGGELPGVAVDERLVPLGRLDPVVVPAVREQDDVGEVAARRTPGDLRGRTR